MTQRSVREKERERGIRCARSGLREDRKKRGKKHQIDTCEVK